MTNTVVSRRPTMMEPSSARLGDASTSSGRVMDSRSSFAAFSSIPWNAYSPPSTPGTMCVPASAPSLCCTDTSGCPLSKRHMRLPLRASIATTPPSRRLATSTCWSDRACQPPTSCASWRPDGFTASSSRVAATAAPAAAPAWHGQGLHAAAASSSNASSSSNGARSCLCGVCGRRPRFPSRGASILSYVAARDARRANAAPVPKGRQRQSDTTRGAARGGLPADAFKRQASARRRQRRCNATRSLRSSCQSSLHRDGAAVAAAEQRPIGASGTLGRFPGGAAVPHACRRRCSCSCSRDPTATTQ
mmetsp:Transcript_17812/g.53385  ORF Transcript_17812/g.53385 Transcript_17812/m.53385 type:complete len:305 (+) Transcript_17812:218-1132(+)